MKHKTKKKPDVFSNVGRSYLLGTTGRILLVKFANHNPLYL